MISRSIRALITGFVVVLLLIGAGALERVAAQNAPGQATGIVATGYGMATSPATTASVQLFVSSYLYGGGYAEIVAVTDTDTPPEPAVESSGAGDATPEAGESGASSGGAGYYGESEDIEEGPVYPEMLPPMTAADVTPVVDALVAAGIVREGIEVVSPASMSMGPGGPFSIQIHFEVADPVVTGLAEVIGAASEAAFGAGLSLDYAGVTYGGGDCAALTQEARVAAVADAQERAEGLAQALGVALGELVQAADYSYYGAFAESTGVCGPRLDAGGGMSDYGFGVQPFDPNVPAEVVAYASVTLTYAFGT